MESNNLNDLKIIQKYLIKKLNFKPNINIIFIQITNLV